MKKFILIVSLAAISGLGLFAGNIESKVENERTATTSLSGQVVDKISGEYLAGVAIKLEGTEKVTYTDFDGNFEFSGIKPGVYQVETTMISYKKATSKVVVETVSPGTIEVQMETVTEQ
ncbi:MAG: carboxypeptidase-like regulatory domain-containing protein [Bacteroidales bacterium]|nr:carboxypeptidase-like regulatory domain-containing protein [Bacteroidales bacterium]